MVGGAGGLHADPGQVGIQVKIEARWSAFDAAQQQMLHGVRVDGAQPEGVLDGVVDLLMGEVLQQTQHLHEFALAPFAHARLQQTAQRLILLGQIPPLQWRGLIQRGGLPLQQRQVVDGIEDKVVLLVGAGMPGD